MVGVIGDGTLDRGSEKWALCNVLGEALVDGGYRIVCGGLGGVMEAVCRGAHASESYREGCTVGIVPGTDAEAANEFVDIVVPTGLGHARNTLVPRSDAVVAVGGGAGTLSEMAFAWIARRLLAAFRVDGWGGRMAGEPLDHRTRFPTIDGDRVYGVDTPEQLVSLLDDRLEQYRNAR